MREAAVNQPFSFCIGKERQKNKRAGTTFVDGEGNGVVNYICK